MNPGTPEPFVDADEAAKFLSLSRRRVLDLARAKKLPAHPIGDGARCVWRFRLNELAEAITSPQKFGLASQDSTRIVRTHSVARHTDRES
jgi:excisionase family DNA binding protein